MEGDARLRFSLMQLRLNQLSQTYQNNIMDATKNYTLVVRGKTITTTATTTSAAAATSLHRVVVGTFRLDPPPPPPLLASRSWRIKPDWKACLPPTLIATPRRPRLGDILTPQRTRAPGSSPWTLLLSSLHSATSRCVGRWWSRQQVLVGVLHPNHLLLVVLLLLFCLLLLYLLPSPSFS